MTNVCQNITVSQLFTISTAINSVLILAGVVANLLLFVALLRSSFLPGNVRLLLANITMGLFTTVFSLSSMTIRGFYISSFGYFVVNVTVCAFEKGVVTCCLTTIFLSTLFLAVERLRSSRKLLEHQPVSDAVQWRVALGCVVINAFAVISAVRSLSVVGSVVEREPEKDGSNTNRSSPFELEFFDSVNRTEDVCYCESFLENSPVLILPLLGVMVAIESAGVLIFVKVWRINVTELHTFSLNTARYSLTERFQMRRNILITNMMVPVACAHGLVWLSFLLISVAMSLFQSFSGSKVDVGRSALIANAFLLLIQLNVLANPLILLARSPYLSDALRFNNNQVHPIHLPARPTATQANHSGSNRNGSNPAGANDPNIAGQIELNAIELKPLNSQQTAPLPPLRPIKNDVNFVGDRILPLSGTQSGTNSQNFGPNFVGLEPPGSIAAAFSGFKPTMSTSSSPSVMGTYSPVRYRKDVRNQYGDASTAMKIVEVIWTATANANRQEKECIVVGSPSVR